ncbi:Pentatricopeptide repeat-containing protein, chloroplastic [Symbiodinium microadriaticum]|uniref:Pentatricopeptide repeat-containing protein, chloroplastic n=1 Tax=Symbiodinium microadriaticum TaxID=2951 RepID=A0A1Q9EEI0_SYMMI|nr:Pentatricopeptide repeat-containing protein, chloroplastic [Symbiodinium microadriaticum]
MLWQEAVLSLAERGNEQATTFVFNRAIHACGQARRWQQALQLLDQLQQERLRPTTITYNSAIGACEKAGDWKRALQLLHALSEQLLSSTQVTYIAAISACAKAEEWQSALFLLLDLQQSRVQQNVAIWNAAMSSFISRGLWQQALDILAEGLCRQQVEADVVTYNAMISTCTRGGQWQLALSTFASLASLSLQPDLVTLNSVLSAFGAAQRWEEGWALLLEMPKRNFKADSFTFTAAISACQSGQWELSLAALEYMRMQALQTDVAAYNAVVSTCGTASRWEQSLQVFKELQFILQADVITYSAAISSCGEATQWLQALTLLSELTLGRLRLDSFAFSSVIRACGKAGLWEKALTLLSQLPRHHLQASQVVYNAAQGAFVDHWQMALALFCELLSQKLGSATSGAAAITACGRAGLWNLGLCLLEELRKHAVKLDESVYLAACRNFLGPWQRAQDSLRTLQQSGLQPGREMQSIAFGAFGAARPWRQAAQLLSEGFKEGLPLSGPWLHSLALMETLRSRGDTNSTLDARPGADFDSFSWQCSLNLLRCRGRADLTSPLGTYDSLMVTCMDQGRPDLAIELLCESALQRSAASFLWALAALGVEEPRVLQGAVADAALALKEGPREESFPIIASWRSLALLGASSPNFERALREIASERLPTWSIAEIRVAAAGAAGSEVPDADFLKQAQRALLPNLVRRSSFKPGITEKKLDMSETSPVPETDSAGGVSLESQSVTVSLLSGRSVQVPVTASTSLGTIRVEAARLLGVCAAKLVHADGSSLDERQTLADAGLDLGQPLQALVRTTIEVGDFVKVKDGVRPAFGWGSVQPDHWGKVAGITGDNCTVHFPRHSGWSGKLDEMELIPTYRPEPPVSEQPQVSTIDVGYLVKVRMGVTPSYGWGGTMYGG